MFRHCEGARMQERQSDVQYLPSQVKSALRKFNKGKDDDCDSFMSNVSVWYKCCVSHLHIWVNGPLCLLNVNLLDSSICKQLIGKMMNHVSIICLIETFLLMKLNCLTNTKTCLSSCKKCINQM